MYVNIHYNHNTMYCLVTSLDLSAPPSTRQSIHSTNVVIATRLAAVAGQIDPSEVVVKKPMLLHAGTQAMDILSYNHITIILWLLNQVRAS